MNNELRDELNNMSLTELRSLYNEIVKTKTNLERPQKVEELNVNKDIKESKRTRKNKTKKNKKRRGK